MATIESSLPRRTSAVCALLRPSRMITISMMVSAVIFTGLAQNPEWFANAQSLPADAQQTCTVTTPVFASWFESGSVTANGVVKPANSVTFPNSPNCSFYQWSEQMFLWLTSPAPIRYGGGGGRIFDSPAFYDVSPADAMGNRTFIAHTNRQIRALNVRTAQVGPHKLPVIMDKLGRMFEVEPAKIAPSGKQLVLDMSGRSVEVARIAIGADRKPVFFNNEGKPIAAPKAILTIKSDLAAQRVAQKFMVDKKLAVFLNAAGNVIETEEGQADGGVLMAQNGSLIYYVSVTNDVFAYFLTGTKNGGITPKPTQFPTTQAELDKITAFAAMHGKTFPDPEALAVEVKSAWIEAAGLPNLNSYITMQATVPTYDKSNPNQWTPNGQKTVQLALVGIHVVGSANGHAEMIWATFEHFGNTPNAAYTYNSTSGMKTVPQNTAGTWLFASNASSGPFNQMHMQNPFGTANIVPIAPFTISPSNTIRFMPFGASKCFIDPMHPMACLSPPNVSPNLVDVSPNPADATAAASNTEIISINNSVLGHLGVGDIRANYYMTGSTWTISGAGPVSNFGNPGNPAVLPGRAVGTSQLANTTMETYQQTSSFFDMFSHNCFSCHVTNTTDVSHMFPSLKPLF